MKIDGFRGIVVFHLYLLHAGQPLRWYALASGRALLRHWQWLLVAGLVVPGIPLVPLLELPSQLLVTMVSPALDWPSRLATLMAVQLVALAWVAARPAVTSVIVGPRTMEQLESLLKGAALVLDDDTLDRIDAIVPPGTNSTTLTARGPIRR